MKGASTEKAKAGMTMKEMTGYIGGLAFVVGFVLAIVAGITSRDLVGGGMILNENVVLTLVILGIIVAILNVTSREVVPILIAAAALLLAQFGNLIILNRVAVGMGTSLQAMVQYLATFMVPVAVISAVRAVLALAWPGD